MSGNDSDQPIDSLLSTESLSISYSVYNDKFSTIKD